MAAFSYFTGLEFEPMPAGRWDEPADCASPRGWYHLGDRHPDAAADRHGQVSRCAGFYLDYSGTAERGGPDGAKVLAVAYLSRMDPVTRIVRRVELGSGWFWTPVDAARWVERAVALELEQAAAAAV